MVLFDPVNVTHLRKTLWGSSAIFVSVFSTSQLDRSQNGALFAVAISMDVLIGLGVILAFLLHTICRQKRRVCACDFGSSFIQVEWDTLLSLAHTLAQVVHGLCVSHCTADNSLMITAPCLPAAMQFLISALPLDRPVAMLPMLSSVIIPFVFYGPAFLHPIPLFLLALALCFTLLSSAQGVSSSRSSRSRHVEINSPSYMSDTEITTMRPSNAELQKPITHGTAASEAPSGSDCSVTLDFFRKTVSFFGSQHPASRSQFGTASGSESAIIIPGSPRSPKHRQFDPKVPESPPLSCRHVMMGTGPSVTTRFPPTDSMISGANSPRASARVSKPRPSWNPARESTGVAWQVGLITAGSGCEETIPTGPKSPKTPKTTDPLSFAHSADDGATLRQPSTQTTHTSSRQTLSSHHLTLATNTSSLTRSSGNSVHALTPDLPSDALNSAQLDGTEPFPLDAQSLTIIPGRAPSYSDPNALPQPNRANMPIVEEMRIKYELVCQHLREMIEAKRKADEDLFAQEEIHAIHVEQSRHITNAFAEQSLRADEMAAKYRELQACLDQEKNEHTKMEMDLTQHFEIKYDTLKQLYSQFFEAKAKADEDLAEQKDQNAEMKLKFDAAEERVAEAIEQKLKADEDLTEQKARTVEMKRKFDVADKQMVLATEQKLKADEDLVQQKEQNLEMKRRFDVAEEQASHAVKEKLKSDEDVVRMMNQKLKADEDILQHKEAHDHLVQMHEKRSSDQKNKFDEDMEAEIQKREAMKSDFDLLTARHQSFVLESKETQKALDDQKAQNRDAVGVYSLLKSKFDIQKEELDTQKEELSKVANQVKVLRWMIPEERHVNHEEGSTSPMPTSFSIDGVGMDAGKLISDFGSNDTSSSTDEGQSAPTLYSSLSNIAHDMRTPLTTALGALEILMDQKVILEEDDRHDLFQKAWSALQTLLILVNNILDSAKVGQSKMQVVEKRMNIRRMAIQVLRSLEVQASQGDIELIFDAAAVLPSLIRTDRFLLQRILTNLIANSLKFTPPKGRVILKLQYDSDRHFLIGSVIDTGMGMTIDEQKSLFSEFYQSGHGKGGTGLGLTIAQQLVTQLGGTISAYSEGKGHGSTFRFEISAPIARDVRTCSIDCNALILDDDGTRYQALAAMLQYVGVFLISPTTARGGGAKPTFSHHVVFIAAQAGYEALAQEQRAQFPDTFICLVIPNNQPKKPARAGLFDASLRCPIDISDLRTVLRGVCHSIDPELASKSSCGVAKLKLHGKRSAENLLNSPCSSPTVDFEDIRVLLCEDNLVNHTLFIRNLKNVKITNVTSAYNGLEAVQSATDEKFTIIIMDCEMPFLDQGSA